MRWKAVAVAMTAVLAAGCVSTENRKQYVKGVSAVAPAHPIWVKTLNMIILGPEQNQSLNIGADAPLYASIVSSPPDRETDRLIAVSSPAFTGSRLVEGGVKLPVGQLIRLREIQPPAVVLTGSKQRLLGGERLPVILVFERAGRVEAQWTPVVVRRGQYEDYPTAPPRGETP
jgi:hypothetical protein